MCLELGLKQFDLSESDYLSPQYIKKHRSIPIYFSLLTGFGD